MHPQADFTFESFTVTASNQPPYQACVRFATSNSASFNPILLYGAPGVGKTHLLHAIGNEVLHSRPHAKLHLTSGETFLNQLIDAIRQDAIPEFHQQIPNR